jgi:hypothetical protein
LFYFNYYNLKIMNTTTLATGKGTTDDPKDSTAIVPFMPPPNKNPTPSQPNQDDDGIPFPSPAEAPPAPPQHQGYPYQYQGYYPLSYHPNQQQYWQQQNWQRAPPPVPNDVTQTPVPPAGQQYQMPQTPAVPTALNYGNYQPPAPGFALPPAPPPMNYPPQHGNHYPGWSQPPINETPVQKGSVSIPTDHNPQNLSLKKSEVNVDKIDQAASASANAKLFLDAALQSQPDWIRPLLTELTDRLTKLHNKLQLSLKNLIVFEKEPNHIPRSINYKTEAEIITELKDDTISQNLADEFCALKREFQKKAKTVFFKMEKRACDKIYKKELVEGLLTGFIDVCTEICNRNLPFDDTNLSFDVETVITHTSSFQPVKLAAFAVCGWAASQTVTADICKYSDLQHEGG